jgi:biopolymer transport protein ExbB/TolQ
VIWWIVLGLVLLGVVLLILVVLPVLRRLARLDRAMMKTRQRAVDAQALQPALDALQSRLAEVSAHAEAVARRAPGAGSSEPGQAR